MAYLMWLSEPAAVVALMWVSLTESNVLSPKSDTCRRTPAARDEESHTRRAPTKFTAGTVASAMELLTPWYRY